ncbi:MAG: coniferyl aldehyde dehydrogenase [Proteobacteria bacterium]|nr:coniferyl aldehyde dehydrogenase [Pseudomonadota bacterium]
MQSASAKAAVPHSSSEGDPQADVARVQVAYQQLRSAARSRPCPPYKERVEHLNRLLGAVRAEQGALVESVAQDFGHRSAHETAISEVLPVVNAIRFALAHLKVWMKPRPRPVALSFRPGRAEVRPQPLGVVGIIAPWNYPFLLAVDPLVSALAAGNRVLLKPSELAPATSALLKGMIEESFDSSHVAVVTGDARVGEAVCKLPLDHLLFTGSTRLGKLVMRAASENLTPVTLELGGKSPVLVHPDFPLERAVERIAVGKFFNAGQTCVAPDYVLLPQGQLEVAVDKLRDQIRKCYPTLKNNPDYTAIIHDGHYARLRALVSDAASKGADVIEVNPAGEAQLEAERKLAPTLLLDVNDDMHVLQEEIFGPLLPLLPYGSLDEALAYLAERPHPLALYYFDSDKKRTRRVLDASLSGGACVNDTCLQPLQEALPFGGVGASGMGAYHGVEGFNTFSHLRGVFYQARFNVTALTNPPFGPAVERLLSVLIGK